jgi:tetratricopeptide (TPR) repeat protein
MLKYQLLEQRFQLLKQQQATLSIVDQFLLLTTVQINTDWVVEQKRLVLTQFKGWQFIANDPAQQRLYLELIEWMIINRVKDDFIQKLEQLHGWYEQWLDFYLSHKNLSKMHLLEIAQVLQQRPLHQSHQALFQTITQQAPGFESYVILSEFYFNKKDYDQALQSYQSLIRQYCPEPEQYKIALKGLLTTLLARRRKYNIDISDAEYALNILVALTEHHIWDNEFEQLLLSAREEVLIDPLKQGRVKETGTFSSIGRGVSLFGKTLGKKLGGRESSLPYSKEVIASAPALLTGLDIEKSLSNNTRLNHALTKLLKQKLPDHEAAITALGLTAGSLWTYSQIDDNVLNAISFASSDAPDSFADLQDIGEHTLESAGAITRLSGYVAEQQVALDLVREGHVVEVPATANQAGWDLLVDGNPVQVKCTMSANYVLEHLEKNPDIPVIVNRELAEQLGHHPLVIIDPNLSHADIQAITHDSLQHLDNFDSLEELLPIPLLSIAFAAHRNYGQFSAGRLDLQQYGKNIGKEVAVRTAGAVGGKLIGGAIGSVAGPVGIIVGAGIGAYVGGLAGGTGADALLREDLCNQRDQVARELIDFARWFNPHVVKPRLQHIQTQQQRLQQKIILPLQQQSHFSEQPMYAQLMAIQYENTQRVQSLYDWLNSQLKEPEFYQTQAGWVALRESSKFFHAGMKSRVARVNQALEKYQALLEPEKVVKTAIQVLS